MPGKYLLGCGKRPADFVCVRARFFGNGRVCVHFVLGRDVSNFFRADELFRVPGRDHDVADWEQGGG